MCSYLHGNITDTIIHATPASHTNHFSCPSLANILADNNMPNKMSCQCPNCERLFFRQRSLKLHVPSCCRMHLAADNTHHQTEHHPFIMPTTPCHSMKMEILKVIEMTTTMTIQTSVILFQLNQASVLMITVMLTNSLRITKKCKDNKVQPR